MYTAISKDHLLTWSAVISFIYFQITSRISKTETTSIKNISPIQQFSSLNLLPIKPYMTS